MAKKQTIQIIIPIITLLVGVFIGMEYKAYQIRVAVNEAFSENSKEISEITDEEIQTIESDTSQKIKEDDNTKVEELTTEEKRRVTLEVVDKGFIESDYMNGIYEDQITLGLKFINKTDKSIKGVQGVITFYDIFDNEILSSRISYDEGIQANEEKIWNAGIGYNQFIDDDIKLKNTSTENLKYAWKVDTVIYQDNTKETFSKL